MTTSAEEIAIDVRRIEILRVLMDLEMNAILHGHTAAADLMGSVVLVRDDEEERWLRNVLVSRFSGVRDLVTIARFEPTTVRVVT